MLLNSNWTSKGGFQIIEEDWERIQMGKKLRINTLGKDTLERRRKNAKLIMQNIEETGHDQINFASPFFFLHLSAGVTGLLSSPAMI